MEMELTPPSSPTRHVLEMEHYDDDDDGNMYDDTLPLSGGGGRRVGSSIPTNPILAAFINLGNGILAYLRLWSQLYPRASMGVGSILVAILLIIGGHKALSSRSKNGAMTRNHLEGDFTGIGEEGVIAGEEQSTVNSPLTHHLDDEFKTMAANIHHLCLFGGNDKCQCEDPTIGQSKSEIPAWARTHNRNKEQLGVAMAAETELDVVFLGDDVVQLWGDGKMMDREYPDGQEITSYFNETFRSSSSSGGALSLGIHSDKTTNVLWRIQHGEIPPTLKAKVFWILMGSNDLALDMCSEDVVTLGILRVAEEIAHVHPNAKVVLQGILPRSNHRDGSLHMTDAKRGSTFRHNPDDNAARGNADNNKNTIWSDRTVVDDKDLDFGHSTTSSALKQAQEQAQQPGFDYYIWPSILAINEELKRFCSNHSGGGDNDEHNHNHATGQFVFFDADDLFVEDVPGKDGREKQIKREYMPNSLLLSLKGHQVLMDAIKTKLDELLA